MFKQTLQQMLQDFVCLFNCRINFCLNHFSYLAAKLLLLIFLNVLLKTKFLTQSLSRVKLTIDLQKKSKGLFLCDRNIKITIVQLNQNVNRY